MLRHRYSGIVLLFAMLALGIVNAPALAETVTAFNIPAQDLGSALREFGRQSNQQILFSTDVVEGKTTKGVKGSLGAETALANLLAGTGLTFSRSSDGSLLISQADAQGASASSGPPSAPVGAPNDQSPDQTTPTQDNSGRLEEITVSARKMPESILKVPVIETVIPAQRLERLQVTEISDLPKIVPGLDMGQNILTIGTQVAIRGVGTTAYDQGVDQSVSLNIDGVTMSNGLAFQSGLFDLGQIEVLKGPQSLFYGKSTTAGVIALRTADPTDKVEVVGRAEYEAEAETWRGEAIASGPVTDTVKLRLAGQYTSSDGYFNHVTTILPGTGAATGEFNHGPDSEDYKIRGTALWDPSGKFSARFKANYTYNRTIDPSPLEYADCPNGTGGVAPHNIPFIGPYDNCQLGRTFYTVANDPAAFPGVMNGGIPFLDTHMAFGSLDLTYHPIHDLSLSSTTGYYWTKALSSVNSNNSTYAGSTLVAENIYNRHSLTEEVRLASEFTTPLNFLIGGYYEDGFLSEDTIILGNTTYHLPANFENGIDSIDIKTYSAFGQLRYRIISQLELAAGLRWTDETRTQNPINLLTGLPVPVATPRIHSDEAVPEFTATYTPTDDLTFFGAYKEGFKSGSFSVATPVTPGLDNSFGDEKVHGGEAGMKSRLLDDHLALNVAAYLYNFSGLQVGAVEPPINGLNVTRTLNAGAARTYGIDMDGAYRPSSIDGLQFNGAANWNHARYVDLTNVPCWSGQTINAGCNQNFNPATGVYTGQNLSGTQMVRAPQWQLNLGFNYEIPIANDYKLVFSSGNSYFSKFPTFLAIGRPNNDQYQTAYAKADLGLELRSPDDRWEFALISKNITDKIVAGNCAASNGQNGGVFGGAIQGSTVSGPAGIGTEVCWPDPGREVWLRLTVKPFAARQ